MPDNGAYVNGGSPALVAWLRSRQERLAPFELVVGQPVTDDGGRGDDHGLGDTDGVEAGLGVHAPVIGHTNASPQESGRMVVRGDVDDSGWTL